MKSHRSPRERSVPPLVRTIHRRVRFEETDALSYMWHGRYASWFEDGREDLGRHYAISYLDFHGAGVEVPLKTFAVDFKKPLRYGETYSIRTSLLWSDACLIEFAYAILDEAGSVMTEAQTTQLMISPQGDLLLEAPEFYQFFREKWKSGQFF